MKKIFIYYSYSGNGDVVADFLKEKDYDIRKVEPKKPLPKPMFFRIMVGGFKAMTKYKDKLIDFNNDISNYDEIVIGSPIWAGNMSSPINTVLNELDLNDKKVTFIFYSGGGDENKATELVKEKYRADVINLKEPKSNKDELQKISR